MELEEYRRKLRRNLVLGTAAFFAFIALFVILQLSLSAFIPTESEGSGPSDFLTGYRLGAFIGLEGCLAVYLISVIATLRSEKRLRKMWIQDNDERKQAIASKASASTWVASLVCLTAGLIVSSFFSMTVFLTLIGVLMIMLICFVVSMIVYQSKY